MIPVTFASFCVSLEAGKIYGACYHTTMSFPYTLGIPVEWLHNTSEASNVTSEDHRRSDLFTITSEVPEFGVGDVWIMVNQHRRWGMMRAPDWVLMRQSSAAQKWRTAETCSCVTECVSSFAWFRVCVRLCACECEIVKDMHTSSIPLHVLLAAMCFSPRAITYDMLFVLRSILTSIHLHVYNTCTLW